MKKNITILLIALLSLTNINAQTPNYEKIESTTQNFINAWNIENWGEVVELTYPEMFKHVPKEALLTSYQKIKDAGVKFSTEIIEEKNTPIVINHKSNKFCKKVYKVNWKMKITGEMLNNKDQLSQSLKLNFGSDNVKFNMETNTFNVLRESKFILVKERRSDWKVVIANPEEISTVKLLIPEEVISKIDL